MWHYLYAFIMQLLLIWCGYITYFQNTVLTDLDTQRTLNTTPPAERLVVFVLDGLSAKYFFEKNCSNVPQLQDIFLHQGQVGISRTQAPNKCWPAHLAIFCGVYKNPDAFCGWTGSLAAYDSVFKHATQSYAWGAAYLLKQFPAIQKAYMHDIPGSEGQHSYKLDEWTFQSVLSFLNSKAHKMQNERSVLFFIQLQGLRQSNGTEMYYEMLNYTQQGIWTAYKRFEQAFPNQRTAYLLTSDHGKTCKGYQAYNGKEVLETPLLLWGAGVSNVNSTRARTFVANKEQRRLPLHIMQQIQLAPLMSALLGLPPPVHNRGQLPTELLNAGARYESHATYITALQLLAQAVRLLQRFERGLLSRFMPGYWLNMQQLDNFIYSGNLLWHQQRFLALREYSDNFMYALLQCVEYYEHYYARALLLFTALAYFGWLHHIRCLLSKTASSYSKPSLKFLFANALIRVNLFLLVAFLLLQRVPWLTSCVLLMSGLIWTRSLKVHESAAKLVSCRHLITAMLLSLCCIAGFYRRRNMAVGYLVFGIYNNRRSFVKRSFYFYIWFILICLLTAITWLTPAMGYWHRNQLVASMIITFMLSILRRSLQRTHSYHLAFNGLVLLLACLHVLNCSRPWLMHLIARAYLCYVFYPRGGKQAVELTIFNLSTLYTLLCTSYEALVLQLLALELQLALRLRKENGVCNNNKQTLAMYLLLYSFYSFFVIGNFAAVDRFRSYMQFTGFGIYSDFINAFVIALKLLLPILLLICVIYANCERTWIYREQIFNRLLFMCNIMAVVLLFNLRNFGTWWDICVRINQFLIVQIIPFILLILCYLVHFLLSIDPKDTLEIPKWNVHKY